MSTESEVKLARYSEVATAADALGRVIGVRRLKPSEQTKLVGMTPELSGYDEMTDPGSGNLVRIPHRMPMIVSASVCKINDDAIPFPRNRAELDSIFDRLDVEGVVAAGECVKKLNESAGGADPKEEAKN